MGDVFRCFLNVIILAKKSMSLQNVRIIAVPPCICKNKRCSEHLPVIQYRLYTAYSNTHKASQGDMLYTVQTVPG